MAASRLQASIDQLFTRIAKNENHVIELSSEYEQTRAFKKQKLERFEKEQSRLNSVVHGQLWVRQQNLENEQ